MIKKIALVVVALIVLVLVVAAMQPDTFRIERRASIAAPPERIFPFIEDFHRWTAWSPWEKIDPALQRTYGGSPSGKGATYAWQGNADVGSGRMEILEATPPARVAIQLEFVEPFEARNRAEFTLVPEGDGDATQVMWAMEGPSQFVGKLIGLFVDMDQMVGKEFETGLANLKSLAEDRGVGSPAREEG